jgi:hypothetical protein
MERRHPKSSNSSKRQQANDRTRTSFWVRTFEHARQSGEWVRVPRTYTHSTAVQIASDISNAHRREFDAHRVRGIRHGERWLTRWHSEDDNDIGGHSVWLRLETDPESA